MSSIPTVPTVPILNRMDTGIINRGPKSSRGSRLYAPNCIESFIEYLKDKKNKPIAGKKKVPPEFANTNEGSVVENLVKLMKMKGFTGINKQSIERIQLTMQNLKFDRAKLINEYNTWLPEGISVNMTGPGGTIQQVTRGNNREYFTFAKKLSDATMISLPGDEQYVRTVSRSFLETDTEAVVEGEKKWILHALTKSKTFTMKKILATKDDPVPIGAGQIEDEKKDALTNIANGNLKKKKCANCWICGKGIYFYYSKTSEDDVYVFGQSCGEDEHVLPPGWGNILGTLGLTYDDTYDMITSQKVGGITSLGLRPSHAFCNKVKSDIAFLDPPTSTKGIDISNTKLEFYINLYKQKLNSGSFIRSLEPLFCTSKGVMTDEEYEKVNGISRNDFAESCKEIIGGYLKTLCDTWNDSIIPGSSTLADTSISGSNNPLTLFALRFIWKSCYDLKRNSDVMEDLWRGAGGGYGVKRNRENSISEDDTFSQNKRQNQQEIISIDQEDLDKIYDGARNLTSATGADAVCNTTLDVQNMQRTEDPYERSEMILPTESEDEDPLEDEYQYEPNDEKMLDRSVVLSQADLDKSIANDIKEDIMNTIEELFPDAPPDTVFADTVFVTLDERGVKNINEDIKEIIIQLVNKIINLFVAEPELSIALRTRTRNVMDRMKSITEQETLSEMVVSTAMKYNDSRLNEELPQVFTLRNNDIISIMSSITTAIAYKIITSANLPIEIKTTAERKYAEMNRTAMDIDRLRERRLGEGINILDTRKRKPRKKITQRAKLKPKLKLKLKPKLKPKPKPKPKSNPNPKPKPKTRDKQKGGKKRTQKRHIKPQRRHKNKTKRLRRGKKRTTRKRYLI